MSWVPALSARAGPASRAFSARRAFQEPAFFDPGRSRHLTIAVQRIPTGKDRVKGLAARQDRGYAGAHRPFPNLELAAALDDGRVPDLDAADIGDGIARSGPADERNPKVPRTRLVSRETSA